MSQDHQPPKLDVVVVGAGVAGLTAAWRLRSEGLEVAVLEARSRVGGRAFTKTVSGRPIDLGATWVWDSEEHVHRLLRELGVQTTAVRTEGADTYDDGRIQRGRLPTSAVPERRLRGGMGALVGALAEVAGPVRMGCAVRAVRVVEGGLVVETSEGELSTRCLLAALPPSLVAPWSPALPAWLRGVPVWMGEIAKCVGLYDRPVWTEAGLSGRAFSRVGPMGEVHDLSDEHGPALFGFAHRSDAHDLEARVAAQLERLFGAVPRELVIQRWWEEAATTSGEVEDQRLFGHSSLRQPFLEGRLRLISCETSGVSPGHLDGAIERAESVCRELGEELHSRLPTPR